MPVAALAVKAIDVHQPPRVAVAVQTLPQHLEQEAGERPKYPLVDVG